MHDFTILPPECVGNKDCGSPKFAITLFISFYVVCTFIFVNLFTVVKFLFFKKTKWLESKCVDILIRLLLITFPSPLINEINLHLLRELI
jgi:hypothetical protein